MSPTRIHTLVHNPTEHHRTPLHHMAVTAVHTLLTPLASLRASRQCASLRAPTRPLPLRISVASLSTLLHLSSLHDLCASAPLCASPSLSAHFAVIFASCLVSAIEGVLHFIALPAFLFSSLVALFVSFASFCTVYNQPEPHSYDPLYCSFLMMHSMTH